MSDDAVRYHEAAEKMRQRFGGPRTAGQWEISLNMKPGDCRDGAMVPGSQGLLVFRTVPTCGPRGGWWGQGPFGWGGL